MKHTLVLILAVILVIAAAPYANADTVRICEACGEDISGPFFETKGNFYHPHHFTCAYCAAPIKGQYTTYRSENYHNDCFRDHIARRCTLCREPIDGEYIVDYWGNAYHKRHANDVPTCDFCDRFLSAEILDGGVRFSDGRSLCGICHKSAIKKLGQAKALMNQVALQMRRIGMNFEAVDFRLHLIGLKRMQEIANFRSHDLRGFTDYHEERDLFGLTRKRQIDVYLLFGMPKVEMIGTMAHELTHVWQFLNGNLKPDPALSEGSCNFAAYWVLRQMAPGRETDFIIESMLRDDDLIYGEGFRRVKRYVERNGISGWLVLLSEENQRLPD